MPFIYFLFFENSFRFREISSLLLNNSTNKIRGEAKVQREIKHGKTREEKKTHIEDESRNEPPDPFFQYRETIVKRS